MRTIAILTLLIAVDLPAKADSWTDYLKVSCEPSIQHFSVQPAGTWQQDAVAPSGFFKLSHGWGYDSDGKLVKAIGSDSFAKCTIPYSPVDILFEVVRIESYPPSECGGCGAWGGLFQVRLNGEVIVEDNLARVGSLAMSSVRFEGEDILICASPQGPSGRRKTDGKGRIVKSCEVIEQDQLNTLLQTGSE